jgi:hypothetical protein
MTGIEPAMVCFERQMPNQLGDMYATQYRTIRSINVYWTRVNLFFNFACT